jgi:hypothetical protein
MQVHNYLNNVSHNEIKYKQRKTKINEKMNSAFQRMLLKQTNKEIKQAVSRLKQMTSKNAKALLLLV